MPTTVTYANIIAYLDAIAADATLDIGGSPHGIFWRDGNGVALTYNAFKSGNVPQVTCNGNAIPIMDQNTPLQSPFFVILTSAAGFCNKPQMPKTGPFITDTNPPYVALVNGTQVTGPKIIADMTSWLSNGFPENPPPAALLDEREPSVGKPQVVEDSQS
jgi:hypothetical protein